MSLSTCKAKTGIAHNGVLRDFTPIEGMKSHISDTMKFVKEVLAPIGNSLNKRGVRDLLELYTDSRFAIMTPKTTYLVGAWEQSASGIFYSNWSYKSFDYDGWNHVSCDTVYRCNCSLADVDDVADAIEHKYGVFVNDAWESVGGVSLSIDKSGVNLPNLFTVKVNKNFYDVKICE